jgi:tetratricopeptide (TPR) repeat protein
MNKSIREIIFILIQIFSATICYSQQRQSSLDEPLKLFFEIKYEQALPLFEDITSKDQSNIQARTWLAETYRRLGRTDDAIKSARIALGLNPCNSFAHLVIAQASYQNSDSVSVHVNKAIQCDSTDPNAWLMMWGEAIKNSDLKMRNKSLSKLVETGFFTKAALAYGRLELEFLPPNAIFVTNGDMDTYPAQAIQVTENFRTDVAVIEKEHLGISWAYRFIRDHQKVSLPFTDQQIETMNDSIDAKGNIITRADKVFKALIVQKQNNKMQQPITVAPTIEEKFVSPYKNNFKYKGMFYLWEEQEDNGIIDTTALQTCLSGINPDSFSGPWASVKDRSPIRRFYTKGVVEILFQIALTYSEGLIKADRIEDAEKTLKWLEIFENKTEAGEICKEEINRLRNLIKQH